MRMRLWIVTLLLCLLGVPVAVYFGGTLLAGPYEGEGGLLGLAATIYADAIRGRASAVILLFLPALLEALWVICIGLRNIFSAAVQSDASSQ